MNGWLCQTVKSIVSAAKLDNESPPTHVQPLLISPRHTDTHHFWFTLSARRGSNGWKCFVVGISLITVIFSWQGKVFPKLRKRVPQGSGSTESVSDKEEDEATDYVFRILFPNSQSEFGEIPRRKWTRASAREGLLHAAVHLFLWKCYWLFVTVTVTHPPHLTSSLSLHLSGQSPSKTGTLVVPKRSRSCPEESGSLTGSSRNTVTPRLVCQLCLTLIPCI